MKHQLISSANFVLLLILIMTLVFGELTKVNPPTLPRDLSKQLMGDVKINQNQRPELPVSQIYGRRNIFGLPSDIQIKEKGGLIQSPEFTELKLPEKQSTAPTQPKDNFIEPLNISINGIITSTNEENNTCIISTTTGEEKMYKVGDCVQDGILMEITKNSVSIIRPNGQIEKFKVGEIQDPNSSPGVDSIVTKLEENNFAIDYLKLSKVILSLGQLVEELGIIPIYKDGICVGLKITRSEQGGISEALGFKHGDIILSADDIPLTDAVDRITAYDKIMRLNNKDSFKIEFERDSSKLVHTYTLEKHKPRTKTLSEQLGGTNKDDKKSEQGQSKTSNTLNSDKGSDSDKKTDIFNKPAEDRERYSSNVSAIRKKLLENANKQRTTHLR